MSSAIIIFVKNPVFGKVKTRLARTIGDEKALAVYQHLILHTQSVCQQVNVARFVFFSDFIEENDAWKGFEKRLQTSGDLGKKMATAFEEIFNPDVSKVIIIGSDCPDITTTIIEDAFTRLNEYNVVVGPAKDGGYYLLGMKKLHPALFEDKSWSTTDVFQQTIHTLNQLQLSYFLLPELNDIDEEKDLAGTQFTDV